MMWKVVRKMAAGRTERSVLLLIETYMENRHLFQCGTKKKMEVWKIVAKQINEKGFKFSSHMCLKKWDNLQNRYKIIFDRNRSTRQGRVSWPYMEIMAEALQKDAQVTPPVIVSNMNGETRGRVQSEAEARAKDQPGTTPATLVRENPGCSAPAFCPSDSIACKATPVRKRKSKDAPEWFKVFDSKIEKLMAIQEEKNHLLKERNNLLKEVLHNSRPNFSSE